MRKYVIFLLNILVYSGHIDYACLQDVHEGSYGTLHDPVRHTRSTGGHGKEGARQAMSDITSTLIQHASRHIGRHVGRVIRSTLLNNKDSFVSVPSTSSFVDNNKDQFVSVPSTSSFVEAPPIGPMETLSIDIKGKSQTYKNFTKIPNYNDDDNDIFKPSKVIEREHGYLRNAITDEVNDTSSTPFTTKATATASSQEPVTSKATATATSYEKEEDDASSTSSADGKVSETYASKNEGSKNIEKVRRKRKKHVKVYTQDRPSEGNVSISSSASNTTITTTHQRKKKRKHNRNRYKVYSGALNNNSLEVGLAPVNDAIIMSNWTNLNASALPTTNTTTAQLSLPQWQTNFTKITPKTEHRKPKTKELDAPDEFTLNDVSQGPNLMSADNPPLSDDLSVPSVADNLKAIKSNPYLNGGKAAHADAASEPLKADYQVATHVDAAVADTLKADYLKATHAGGETPAGGDGGIQHDAPQDLLKEGHEQGPLPAGHEQGPKLPEHEKGPLLPGHQKGPLLPGQTHAGEHSGGNFSTHHEDDGDEETVVDEKAAGQCSPCLGTHGLGVPVVIEDGSLHCEPCHGHKLGLLSGGHIPNAVQWNPLHSQVHSPSYTHTSPFQILLPNEASVVAANPQLNELPFPPTPPHLGLMVDETPPPPPPPPPHDDSLPHDEFEKIGHSLNPELLSVIENNNHKINALWNEVKNVEARLGNIESVVEVVEKAVQKIEAKLDVVDENDGVYVDDPIHQKTIKIKIPSPGGRPSFPQFPSIPEYPDSHVTEGFPHSSRHSPVLKQYFIPLQSNIGSEGIKEIDRAPNTGNLPWPVSKFLNFLMQELQRDKSVQPAELALQLPNIQGNNIGNIPPRVPHVPLPQPDLPYPPKEHDIDRLEYEIGRLPKNKFGQQKNLHPEAEDATLCQCENGGQCNGRSECDCPIRYTGPRCERPVPRSPLLDSIIDDMPTETQRQFRGGQQRSQSGMITLPLVISDKDDQDSDQQKRSESMGEMNQARLVNLLSQFFTPEYLQKFSKRQKVNVRRRYVKYPVEKEK